MEEAVDVGVEEVVVEGVGVVVLSVAEGLQEVAEEVVSVVDVAVGLVGAEEDHRRCCVCFI